MKGLVDINLPVNMRCTVPGCYRKKTYSTPGYYRKVCSYHHGSGKYKQYKFVKSCCELCAWVGPCEIHRIKLGCDGGQYSSDNVITVCPNCHTLIHRGLLVLNEGVVSTTL
jgi:hypothetical protein